MTNDPVVEALFNKCVRCVVKQHPLLQSQYDKLPPAMKTRVLTVLLRRGGAEISYETLKALLHSRIQKLDFSQMEKPMLIKDEQIQLIGICKNLVYLNLNSLTEVSGEALCAIFPSFRLLRNASLLRCAQVNDLSIQLLTKSAPSLMTLTLGGCPLVTDAALKSIADNCRHLTALSLCGTQITDQGVIRLAQSTSGQKLQELMLDRCKLISDESIEAVASFCPDIKILTFAGCPNITERSRMMIEELQMTRGEQLRQITWTIY